MSAAATCLTAGAVFCAPVRRFFESRLSGFLGWISFPLYLVQAAVIYALAPRGLELLAFHGFAPETAAMAGRRSRSLPIAIPVRDRVLPDQRFGEAASRRFGAGFVAFAMTCRRWARRSEPGRAGI